MNLIYLMGAGRSGTTLLATLLGNVNRILTLGEMHQFLDYAVNNKPCSCGKLLNNCEFWGPVINNLHDSYTETQLRALQEHCTSVEKHSRIPKSFFKKDDNYIAFQSSIFKNIALIHQNQNYVLDSSKYVGRALQLRHLKNKKVKVIYVIRDIRGVINSFKKNVQTPKKPLGTVVYYTLINVSALLACALFGKNKVLRLRYEDLVLHPSQEINRIENFLGQPLTEAYDKVVNNKPLIIPHVIGGNRLVRKDKITLKLDQEWKKTLSRPVQVCYYLLALPLMLVFKYKI